MASLRTQYLKFLRENSNSNFTYDDWFEYVYKENINKFNISDSKLKITKIITHLNNLSSDNLNISDIGTEIGIAIGGLTDEEIDSFINGFKEGYNK